MPLFYYKAKDKSGKSEEGTLESSSEALALRFLRERGLVILALWPKKDSTRFGSLTKIFRRVSRRDLVIFYRQLAVMSSASVPLVQALRNLIDQTANPTLKEVISQIADEVEGGAKLSQAFSHSPYFSDFIVNILKSGETTGQLDVVLNYIADEEEKDYDLVNRIRGAIAYPLIILLGVIAVGSFMVVSVVPRFSEVVQGFGQSLPLSTRLLINVSDFLVNFGWLILIIILVLVLGLKYYIKTNVGRVRWDYLKLKIPIFGRFLQKVYLVRLTRSLSTLLKGGVPVTLGLKIVSQVVGNVIFQDLILKTIKEVDDGHSIATVFIESKVVPVMVSQMMITGEHTGRLEEILEKLADFYAREVDNMMNNLIKLLEPVIIILMGVLVGILMSAIILPMYNLALGF